VTRTELKAWGQRGFYDALSGRSRRSDVPAEAWATYCRLYRAGVKERAQGQIEATG
jgi:hypothetical protein